MTGTVVLIPVSFQFCNALSLWMHDGHYHNVLTMDLALIIIMTSLFCALNSLQSMCSKGSHLKVQNATLHMRSNKASVMVQLRMQLLRP